MKKIKTRGNKILTLIIALIIFTTGVFAVLYVFNIYGIIFSSSCKNLTADNISTIKIEAVPVNAFGKRVPFRSVYAEYEIIEGKSIISISTENKKTGLLVLKSKYKTGKVLIKAHCNKSLLPSIIEFNIRPKE